MSSPPVIGGSEESVVREEDRRISNEELRNRHTLKRKASTSQRGLTSPTRSTNDMMAGLRRRNTDKPKRRRSDSTTASSTPSKRDLTKPMMELQRINKARRLLEDVKRIAENWIYMLKQVEEQESIFTAELMERLDDDSDDLSDSESSKNAPTLERPKSGTLILSKDYNLERYALPGIHLPKSMVRLFYEYVVFERLVRGYYSLNLFQSFHDYDENSDTNARTQVLEEKHSKQGREDELFHIHVVFSLQNTGGHCKSCCVRYGKIRGTLQCTYQPRFWCESSDVLRNCETACTLSREL